MAGGVRGRANPDYSSTEYSQPWGGIDVSKPASQIAPGAAVSLTGSIIRGGLTNSPSLVPPTSSIPVILPAFAANEWPLLIAECQGVTIVVSNTSVYSDAITIDGTKTFRLVFTGLGYTTAPGGHVGSVVIGNTLYFSSSTALGVYAATTVTGTTVTEISAQNGSGPFIGGDFLGTISQRLILWNIRGGDGNQTGSVNSVAITTGGTGYPASGQLVFTGGGGQNATGTFTATAGVVTSVAVTAGGTGYLTGGTISIVGTSGTGFTGTFGISASAVPSTSTNYPDRVAWSFPSAYGSFDPNSILLGGGFDQLTEARGLGTGLAVFEAVCFLGHNGGFTEMTPNTSGGNTDPFTFNPLWSADQGIVCRYGSLAQYGAMCYFLGYDQPYNLSPSGITPIGNQVASLVQDFSIWTDQRGFAGGFFGITSGLLGSIVEIEGEKHYILAFTSNLAFNTIFYDYNINSDAWATWTMGINMTSPVYQAKDVQLNGFGGVVRDNWLLIGYVAVGHTAGVISQVIVGDTLFSNTQDPLIEGSFGITFRAETPTMAIPQTTRRLLLEYENLSATDGPVALEVTLFGQPQPNSAGVQQPISNAFTVELPYYSLTFTKVLTFKGEPVGTAITSLATQMSFSTSGLIRLIRTALIAETTQGELQ